MTHQITLFGLIKFITVMGSTIIPSFREQTNEMLYLFLQFNITEAILFDFYESFYSNAFLGLFVMLSIPKHNNNKFKVWSVLYFIWNMMFCFNQQLPLSDILLKTN